MKKRSTFFSILISYLIIMTIPMVLLGGILINFFYNTFNSELIENRINSLHRIQVTMDSIVNGMHTDAFTILNSTEFSSLHLQEQYGNFYDVVRQLSSTDLTNPFIDNTFYVNDETKRVYTPLTMFNYDDFRADKDFNFSGSDVMQLLVRNNRSYWLPMQHTDSNSFLTYVITNKMGQEAPNASIAFQINQSTLDQLMGEFTSDSYSCVIISDAGNDILYSSNPVISDAAWSQYQQNITGKKQKYTEFKANQETYIAFQQPSEDSSIYYVSIVPYQSLTAPIAYHRNIFIAGMILVSLLSFCFITYFMRVNYSSVRSISKLVNSILVRPSRPDDSDTDEFEATKQTLLGIQERGLKTERNNMTLKLLRNGFTDMESFLEEGLNIRYNLSGPFFIVIIFQLEEFSEVLNPERYQEMADFIVDDLNVYVDCNSLIFPESKSILITASGEDEQLEGLDVKLEQIRNVIQKEFSTIITVGVGNKAEVGSVAVSYSQASTACGYKFIKGEGSILFYKNISEKANSKIIYPTREMDTLYHAILQGDEEQVQFAMQNLLNYILNIKSLFYCICLAYDILNTAIKAMRELNGTVSELLQEIDTIQSGKIRSIDDVVKIVNIVSKKIVDTLDYEKEHMTNVVPLGNFEQILKYISENYNKESFSIKSMADYFGMSVSNLSHYFKKHMNQTVSDYVSALRFEKAREYLRTTDMNLQDVAAMCGYLNLSTFMRQFKQRESCTPASYRAKYRQ
jgi:AraC-type DNA-binding domain-containing proteins